MKQTLTLLLLLLSVTSIEISCNNPNSVEKRRKSVYGIVPWASRSTANGKKILLLMSCSKTFLSSQPSGESESRIAPKQMYDFNNTIKSNHKPLAIQYREDDVFTSTGEGEICEDLCTRNGAKLLHGCLGKYELTYEEKLRKTKEKLVDGVRAGTIPMIHIAGKTTDAYLVFPYSDDYAIDIPKLEVASNGQPPKHFTWIKAEDPPEFSKPEAGQVLRYLRERHILEYMSYFVNKGDPNVMSFTKWARINDHNIPTPELRTPFEETKEEPIVREPIVREPIVQKKGVSRIFCCFSG